MLLLETSMTFQGDSRWANTWGEHLGLPSRLFARMEIPQRFGSVSGGNEDLGAVLG